MIYTRLNIINILSRLVDKIMNHLFIRKMYFFLLFERSKIK